MANQFLDITDENGNKHFLNWNYVVTVRKSTSSSGARVFVAHLGSEAPRGVIDVTGPEYERVIAWLSGK